MRAKAGIFCRFPHTVTRDKHGKCPACRKLWTKRYQKAHPDRVNLANRNYRAKYSEKVRNYVRKFEYLHDFGITLNQYDMMLAEQNHSCAICKRPQSDFWRRLAVDHDHKSGKVRGLLCDPCNRGMGMLKEHNLVSAIAYLMEAESIHG